MPNYDLESWLRSLNFPPATANLIRHIVKSPPSRKGRSNGKNVRGFYPSKKRGQTIQFESHRNELCYIMESEYDNTVLDYFDQPPRITVQGKTAAGRNHGYDITPDFFVIKQSGAGWIECKTIEKLLLSSKENPNRYTRDENGKWHFLPGEEYAEKYGLFFEVYSTDQIDWIWQRNCLFMEDYLRDKSPSVADGARAAIISRIKSTTGITLSELLIEPRHYSADDIYTLIAIGEIYIDLLKYPIVETNNTRLFIDRDLANAYTIFSNNDSILPKAPQDINVFVGASFMWDGKPWQIINVGNKLISLQSADNAFVELSRTTFEELAKQGKLSGLQVTNEASEAQLLMDKIRLDAEGMQDALKKYDIIVPFLNGVAKDRDVKSNRTVRHYLTEYELAQQKYGSDYGLLGLFDKSNPGNFGDRISDKDKELIETTRTEFYETDKCLNKTAAYGYYLILCEKEGVKTVSWKTFRKYLSKGRPKDEVIRNREGDRVAYKDEPFYFYLTLTTPRHGDRPFEICHIDHTEVPLETASSEVNMRLGKPWLTFLTDAYSRRDLAFYLTFNKPSYISNMMVLRECVARHGRLPQTIVFDGGADFRKTEFEILLAKKEITKKIRPGAKSRFGSPCERLFGTTMSEFFHVLMGNTKIMKNVRQVTKKNNPRNKAIWPIEEVYSRLQAFLYEEYDTRPHPALDESPRDAFNRGISMFGNRPFRMIPYDNDFIRWTLPRPRIGTSRISTQRGIKINEIYYHSPILRNPIYENVKVERRYDPFNVGVAYVYLNNLWVECYSEFYSVFAGRSIKELQLLSTEIRQRKIINGRKLAPSAKELALRCQAVDQDEKVLKQRQRDREMKTVHSAMTANRFSRDKAIAQEAPIQDMTVRDEISVPIPITSPKRKSSLAHAASPAVGVFSDY